MFELGDLKMINKLFFTSSILFLILCNTAFAYFASNCALDGYSISGNVNGVHFETDVIDCELAGSSCQQSINIYLEVGVNLWEIYPITIYCNQNDMFIDNIRVFIDNGVLVMPNIAPTHTHTFISGSKTFIYPDIIEVYQFTLEH